MTIGFFADRRLCFSQTHDWRWSVHSDSKVEASSYSAMHGKVGFKRLLQHR